MNERNDCLSSHFLFKWFKFFLKTLDKIKINGYTSVVIWKNYNSLCEDGGMADAIV